MSEAFSLRFSHVGLFVTDMARLVAFYRDVLGFTVTDRGRLGEVDLTFLSRDPAEHHQIVLASGRPAGLPDRIVNQVSFRVPSLEALQLFHRRIRRSGATDIQPVTHGNAWSVYFRDPDGNRIEVFVDSDWYVTQPVRESLDLERPADEIRRDTEALCRRLPGFRPIEDWRRDVTSRIAAHEHALAQ
jgi:catechol 2,3-dioxygenase